MPDASLRANFARPISGDRSQAAQESITLLQNKKAILPLAKDKKILVTALRPIRSSH
jgi:beta-glucosidase-like glycosyl hydrolase